MRLRYFIIIAMSDEFNILYMTNVGNPSSWVRYSVRSNDHFNGYTSKENNFYGRLKLLITPGKNDQNFELEYCQLHSLSNEQQNVKVLLLET